MVFNTGEALVGFLIKKEIINQEEFDEYCKEYECLYEHSEEGEDN